ncbi:UNVERIFIED_ORG: hypothetical protein BDK47_1182 [Anoxybacillus amylolyticus]
MAYLFLEKEEVLDLLGGEDIVFCEQDKEEWIQIGERKKKMLDCCSLLAHSLGEMGKLIQEKRYDVEEVNGQMGYLFFVNLDELKRR